MAKAETLTDDFAANDKATKWSASTGTVTITGGTCAVLCDTAFDSALIASTSYDLTSSYIQAQVTPYKSGTSPETWLEVGNASGAFVGMEYSAGALVTFSLSSGGTLTTHSTVTYSAANHAWWRLREAAGSIFFEVSANGTEWFGLDSMTSPFAVTAVTPQVGGGISGGTAGNAVVDNFNIFPSASKAQTLTDSFPGSVLDTGKWQVINGTASVSGGQLVLPCTTGYTTVQSAVAYDLTSSFLFAKLSPDQGGSGFETAIYAGSIDGSTGYIMGYENGNLEAAFDTGFTYTSIGSATYNATSHAWVKISESGGTVTYWSSPDGITWTSRWTSDTRGYPIKAVYLQAYSGHTGGADGTSRAASFNVTPSSVSASGLLMAGIV